MPTENFPHTERSADSPSLDSNDRGVLINCPNTGSVAGPIVVRGAFQLDGAMAETIDAQLHRALVVAAVSIDDAEVCVPFQEHALFPDDEVQVGHARRGYFNVDLSHHLKLSPRQEYFVHVSLGPLVSNLLRLQIK